ncbi:MAG TPA: hypothetical protein VFF18_17015 [Woeseiaceae bacterium]|nr:hypothetical protein [Woeseiaceae bacterium]
MASLVVKTSCIWPFRGVRGWLRLMVVVCAIASVSTGLADGGSRQPSGEIKEIVRPADVDEVSGLSGWFDETFEPEMHLKVSAFIYIDWQLYEWVVDGRSGTEQPLRIRIDLGITEPVEMEVQEISWTTSNTVTSLSGPVYRNDVNVGSGVIRPAIHRKEFRGYIRLPEGKFVISPTPRLPTHIVYLNDWEAIRKADNEYQQQVR